MKNFEQIYSAKQITSMAKDLFCHERSKTRLDGWFIAKEIELKSEEKYSHYDEETKKAYILKDVVSGIPLDISEHNVFVGTQDDSFAKSYALINPSFKVEEFSGYCDPTAVFNDIEPNEQFTKERIEKIREIYSKTPYVSQLTEVYDNADKDTKEVVYFIEQVTGHLIPDFRYAIKHGVCDMMEKAAPAMKIALESVIILANRYKELAKEMLPTATDDRKPQLELIISTLDKIPQNGAENIYEAIQMYILLWQVMCLEQSPNPFAFSVGNADRIFEPYRNGLDREYTAALLKHFLVFFNVADRSWAISQNILISGRDVDGEDLTNETTYALLDAYYDMNMPQPILSVKLHKNTPDKLYKELGKFFFSPGVLTPSLFNDDSLFEMLKEKRIAEEDLPDISVAGCQEPLIMGKDNANTTNSWLNLPKILELTLTGGVSLVTGEKLSDIPKSSLSNIKENFYKNVELYAEKMAENANGATKALSNLKVPFLSCFMGGLKSGIDARNCHTYIIGEHGDSEVAAWSITNIGGMTMHEFCNFTGKCSIDDLNKMHEEEKKSAYEIIEKKGATYYAIAVAVERIVECIAGDENSILTVSSIFDGQYGISDVALSVPTKVGGLGVERVFEVPFSDEELEGLKNSANTLKESFKKLDLNI